MTFPESTTVVDPNTYPVGWDDYKKVYDCTDDATLLKICKIIIDSLDGDTWGFMIGDNIVVDFFEFPNGCYPSDADIESSLRNIHSNGIDTRVTIYGHTGKICFDYTSTDKTFRCIAYE